MRVMESKDRLDENPCLAITDGQLVDGIGDFAQRHRWFVVELGVLGGEHVLVVSDEEHVNEAESEHPGLVVYLSPEIQEMLRRLDSVAFRRVHRIKKALDGWIVPEGSPWAYGPRRRPGHRGDGRGVQKGKEEGQRETDTAQAQVRGPVQLSLWG